MKRIEIHHDYFILIIQGYSPYESRQSLAIIIDAYFTSQKEINLNLRYFEETAKIVDKHSIEQYKNIGLSR